MKLFLIVWFKLIESSFWKLLKNEADSHSLETVLDQEISNKINIKLFFFKN